MINADKQYLGLDDRMNDCYLDVRSQRSYEIFIGQIIQFGLYDNSKV